MITFQIVYLLNAQLNFISSNKFIMKYVTFPLSLVF